MKTIKSIALFAVLLIAGIFLQAGIFGSAINVGEDILTSGDTIAVFDVAGAEKVVVTMVDSSDTKIDTLLIQTRNAKTTSYWSTVTAHAINQTTLTTNVASLLPGDNSTTSYEITSDGVFTDIRLVRTNANGYTPRTKVAVKWK